MARRRYPSFAVTVDIVVLTIRDARLHVLLVRRGEDPFAGTWALPGGFKQPDETLDAAAARELREETSVESPATCRQFGAYGDPGRDPRSNVVTVAYLAVTPTIGDVEAGTDAAEARVWPIDDALTGAVPLAFDHEQILRDAIDRVARDLEHTALVLDFVEPEFTLRDVQDVYEAVWGVDLDAANFRRSLGDETDGYVVPTGRRAPSGSRGGRPPELFRAGDAWETAPPLRRPRHPV